MLHPIHKNELRRIRNFIFEHNGKYKITLYNISVICFYQVMDSLREIGKLQVDVMTRKDNELIKVEMDFIPFDNSYTILELSEFISGQ